MIIGEALKRLIDGTEVELTKGDETVCKNIKFHYGDQKELIKWIDDRQSDKYPLVWYVVNPYFDEPDGYKNVTSTILIMQWTDITWFNSKRTLKSYDEVIEPVWQKVKELLDKSNYIQVMGSLANKYRIKDEPNFGVNNSGIRLGQTDFTNKQSKGDSSISLDTVDGRIIELNFRIKTNCI
ncbi:MAG: hypothetical protein HRU26_05620 [Psychroserpens sp.]|nr:hypothetical protein [Psychroserpens sp.]